MNDIAATTPTDASARSPLCQKLAKVVLPLFIIYVAALYLLALDQQFHWGLFPTKLDRQLTAQVKQLGDASLSPQQKQELSETIVSWNTFAVPILIDAIEKNQPGVRAPAAQCLQEIAQKFYNIDITPYATDSVKLKVWWNAQQAQWEAAEKKALPPS